jgi:hypothetical protein
MNESGKQKIYDLIAEIEQTLEGISDDEKRLALRGDEEYRFLLLLSYIKSLIAAVEA